MLANNDLIFISEHWLSNLELFLLSDAVYPTHQVIFHSAEKNSSGRPFGGTCFLIRESIFKYASIIHEDHNILSIKLSVHNLNFIIVGVYLTSCHDRNTSLEAYKSELNNLNSIINSYIDEGEVIMLGDFQSFPSTIYNHEARKSVTLNYFSEHLESFITQNDLTLVDVTAGTGPRYTYHHKTLNHSSYIDHIAVLNHTNFTFSNCRVHEPSNLNMSDHLPITCTLHYEHTSQPNYTDDIIIPLIKHPPPYVWKKAESIIDLYNEEVSLAFNNRSFTDNETELDWLHDQLIKCTTNAFNKCYPNQSNRRFSKPWWSEELTQYKRILNYNFNLWKFDDFTRDPNSINYNRYQLARKNFRKAVKHAQNKLLYNHYINIDKLRGTKPQKFWKTLRSLKKTTNPRQLTINNKKNNDDITNEFANHFNSLFNTPRIINDLTPPVRETNELVGSESFLVSTSDIIKSISMLKLGKSRDQYGILAEHIKFADNDNFISWLTTFYNNISRNNKLPENLSSSIIIPLVKSYKKSLNSPNNYRGISLIPIITKLLEYIILSKCSELTDTHPCQFGFKSNSSTLHAEFTLKETITHYNDKNSPIYMCSLDAEKAFDSCDWNLLFDKLRFDKKLPQPVINVISSLYRSGSAIISYAGVKSKPFHLTQGVRQGSILSPLFYNIYTEKLLSELSNDFKIGTSINGIYTGIIAYADDIILMSPTLSGLQKMINKCVDYGFRNKIKFNPTKTEFIISGNCPIKTCYIKVDNNVIKPVNSLQHLGFKWQIQNTKLKLAKLQHSHFHGKVSELWAATRALVRNGIRFCHPSTISYLYKSLLVPKLTYGLELCKLNNQQIEYIDSQCRSALKSLFNISKYSRNYLNSILNIPKASDTVEQNKLNLFIRLLRNNCTQNIILTKLATSVTTNSFVQEIFDICSNLNINFYKLLIEKKLPRYTFHYEQLPNEKLQKLLEIFELWRLPEKRQEFIEIMQDNIPDRVIL